MRTSRVPCARICGHPILRPSSTRGASLWGYAFVTPDIGGACRSSFWPRGGEIFRKGCACAPPSSTGRWASRKTSITIGYNCHPRRPRGDIKAMVAAVSSCDGDTGDDRASSYLATVVEGIDASSTTRAAGAGGDPEDPDGTIVHEYMETTSARRCAVRIQVALTIEGYSIHLDFIRHDPQVARRSTSRPGWRILLARRSWLPRRSGGSGHPSMPQHSPAGAGDAAAASRNALFRRRSACATDRAEVFDAVSRAGPGAPRPRTRARRRAGSRPLSLGPVSYRCSFSPSSSPCWAAAAAARD